MVAIFKEIPYICKMNRHLIILISFLLFSVPIFAEGSLPIIEIKADRTLIYSQRMELAGEESLMDVLQMVPELMIAGYVDVIDNLPKNHQDARQLAYLCMDACL